MKPALLAKLRLQSQNVIAPLKGSATDLVRAMGAVQAQDYESALWALGVRTGGATRESVEQEVAGAHIVRTWPMRRTLHFVPAEDARWMVGLSAERVIASAAGRAKQLELDDKVFAKTRKVTEETLADGKPVTRDDFRAALIKARLPAEDSRASHLFWRMAQESLICFGPRSGKQPTFVLLDQWVSNHRAPDREEASRILAQRFFKSHGPATIKDFTWWSGLKVSEAKGTVAALKEELEKVSIEGTDYWMTPGASPPARRCGVHLLPAFDEIVIAYQDRAVTLAAEHANHIVPGGNGMFMPMILDEARVTGTWKRTLQAKKVKLSLIPFGTLPKTKLKAFEKAADAFGKFLGLSAVCEVQDSP